MVAKHGLKGNRWYIAVEPTALSGYLVIGWDLDHEPNEDNECGYQIAEGPFATESEAKAAMQEMLS